MNEVVCSTASTGRCDVCFPENAVKVSMFQQKDDTIVQEMFHLDVQHAKGVIMRRHSPLDC